MKPLVALVAHDVTETGGMERAMAELLRHGQDDWRFVVVSRVFAPELRHLATWRPVRVPARPAPLRFACFYVAAGLAVRRLRADLVHTCGALVPNRADVATVHFCHAGYAETRRGMPDDLPLARRANNAILRALAIAAERWSYRPRRTAVVASVSTGVRDEVARAYPAYDGDRLPVTPNGVDVARFAPDAGVRRKVRESAGAADNDCVLLFLAGNWPQKGLDVLVDALGVLRARGASVPLLWVVGSGDSARYAARASRAGVGDRVVFHGPTTTPERWYPAADVFVLPTNYETFSLVCHEAAAAGLPIVATPVNGVSDLVTDGESGVLVDRAAEPIAGALEKLAADPDLRARLGAEARRRVAGVTWDASYEATARAYRLALAAKRAS